ncbi:MAG: hypothetical protein NTV54_12060, partial [Ignavibacteriales bacterium]|nr:hypothetical protein [Ignavibacteriales bacterium]
MVLVLSCFGISLLFARNQKLLFNDSTLKSIRNTYNKPSLSFPFDAFKSAINGYGSVTRTIVAGTDFASYDAEKADLAKLLAFRYCVETNAGVEFGDRAFYWLSTKYAEDNYVYQVNDWSSWMVNAMALKDYCLAFDILCAGGYFDPQNHPSDPHNQVYWEGLKQAILQKLHEKAAAIYNRVKNFRTVNDAAGALFGNPTVLNEAKFHAQVGNHRIIVAAGLGVAAYLLSDSLSSTETDLWLNYAKTDVEQFLLGRQRYPPIGGVTVVSQNVEGAFPEGVEYLNYSGLAFIPFMIASRLNGGENYLQDPNFKK